MGLHAHLVKLFVLFINLNAIIPNEAQQYSFIFSDFQCSVNNDFVANFSCFINKTQKNPSLNMDIQMKKEVTDFRLDFFVYIEKSKKESVLLFKVIGLEVCSILERDFSTPILQVYKNALIKPSSSVPKGCPVSRDFRYKLYNITLDTDLLPVYIPETAFKLIIINKESKTMFWHTTTLGKVIRRKKNRSRQKS